jgi:hypothetical protein
VTQGKKGAVVEVLGSADADSFRKATLSIGAGEQPSTWQDVVKVNRPVRNDLLGAIPAGRLGGAKVWIVRLVTEHATGKTREFRFRLATG